MNPSKADPDRPPVTESRIVLLFVLVAVVLWTGVLRYRDPVGEKYFPLMEPGAADFSHHFDGTKVFLDGNDPYHYRDAASADRWNRSEIIGGRWFRISYPPSHFLLYAPLALVTTDNREAGRLMFTVAVGLYLGMAVLLARLIARVTAPPSRTHRAVLLALMPVLAFLLAGNIGSSLSLCRVQSDVLSAAMAWSAVFLFLRGGRFWPTFLLFTASAAKGYPALLGLGLFLLGLRRGGWKPQFLAVALGIVVWILPVAPYLREGFIGATSHADGFFTSVYFNHSYLNTCLHVARWLARPGRWALGIVTLAVSIGCWWHARAALAADERRDAGPAATLWIALFATAAMLLTVGMSTLSYLYNQILILPGALFLFSVGDRLWEHCGLPPSTARILFALECVTGFLLLKYLLPFTAAPLAGMGNVALLLLLAVAVAARFARRGDVPAALPPSP